MNDDEDIVNVRECLRGNTRAFEVIVQKYQRPLYNLAFRMLSSTHGAEEVVQSVFIRAFENIHTFHQEKKFYSWIYRIAINESINFRNKSERLSPMVEEIAATEPSQEEIVSKIEIKEKIQYAVSKLKSDYQTVIILKHFQDLSYDEIGVILGIPEKTVKSRLFTARKELKNLLLPDTKND
jgi:RNA polymerase sigma-70 factor (ECF subfamily)